jgi:VanZ family protein
VSRFRPGRALKAFRRPWLWSGLWSLAVAVVVMASLLPAAELPAAPGSDKLHHFLAYLALAAMAVQLYGRWASLLGAGLGLVLLGVGLEHLQGALVDSRTADRWDALANTLGVIAGLATRMSPWHDALWRWESRRD